MVPFARPRMPSVPKYLRTMSTPVHAASFFDQKKGQFKSGCCIAHGKSETIINENRRLGRRLRQKSAAEGEMRYLFGFLSCTLGGGWVTLGGSEAGKLSSRPRSSDLSALRRCSSRSSSLASCRLFSSISFSVTLGFGIPIESSWVDPIQRDNACSSGCVP